MENAMGEPITVGEVIPPLVETFGKLYGKRWIRSARERSGNSSGSWKKGSSRWESGQKSRWLMLHSRLSYSCSRCRCGRVDLHPGIRQKALRRTRRGQGRENVLGKLLECTIMVMMRFRCGGGRNRTNAHFCAHSMRSNNLMTSSWSSGRCSPLGNALSLNFAWITASL